MMNCRLVVALWEHVHIMGSSHLQAPAQVHAQSQVTITVAGTVTVSRHSLGHSRVGLPVTGSSIGAGPSESCLCRACRAVTFVWLPGTAYTGPSPLSAATGTFSAGLPCTHGGDFCAPPRAWFRGRRWGSCCTGEAAHG